MAKQKIVVHEKALAHLSRGLYRSPASAIRELISNGWDANARNVYVDTNYPSFFQVSVRDDGDGFSKQEFERLMAGNIGNSEKRPKQKTLINNRATIGRLGIGLLGIAQICGSFKLTSKPIEGEAFCARIHLYDLLKELLDRDDEKVVRTKEAGGLNPDGEPYKEVDVGEYEYIPFDPDALEKGTIIVTEAIHPTFTQTFVESLKGEFFEPGRDWDAAITKLSRQPGLRSLQQLGDYWRLIWELAASCPVPYLSATCLPDNLAKQDFHRLEGYDFKVFVDGIHLRKPVKLIGNSAGYTVRQIKKQEMRIYGRTLAFHGYVVVQEGLQLKPDELRGIMIRIKDVGIGYYDPTMLDYRFNEGPRSRWLTGEIFVSSGLEDALNIDRDSFNKFHPQYRAVQHQVHSLLHEELFKEVYKNIEVRSKERHKKKTKDRRAHFKSVLQTKAGNPVEVRYDVAKSDDDPAVVKKSGGVELHVPTPAELPTKKANQELAASILGIFEVAMQYQKLEERRAAFKEMLLDLLKKW